MEDPFSTERPAKLGTPPHSESIAENFERLAADMEKIDWASYETAYGSATPIPYDLKLLLFGNLSQAMDASHRIWCSLCHQHAFVSSAAEPALDYILLALNADSDRLKVEILDIILGFTVCRNASEPHTVTITSRLVKEKERFRSLASASSVEVRDFALDIHERLCRLQQTGGSSL